MNWLSQNWIWIVAAIGFFYLMSRMHGMGHGMGHSTGRGYGGYGTPPLDQRAAPTTFDPVSRRVVDAGSAISAVYRDRVYYFENREDREAFEANPDKYVTESPTAGQPIASPDPRREQPRRRGC